jgi:hypothetical protein
MITCKLTGEVGQPVKAHIVPKAFYELPPQSEGPCRLISNASDTYPKKVAIGIYDDTIVTKAGEARFGPWDDYASRVLLQRFDEFTPMRHNSKIVAWSRPHVDYAALKLFTLSVLWRAHASAQPAFRKVRLGVHEPIIRNLLLRGDPASEEEYSVCIARWIDEQFGPVFMDPFREKYEGVNYYRIYCGRYVLYVKVDKLKSAPSFQEMQLAPGRPLCIIARTLRSSKEWPLMLRIARGNAHHIILGRNSVSRKRHAKR